MVVPTTKTHIWNWNILPPIPNTINNGPFAAIFVKCFPKIYIRNPHSFSRQNFASSNPRKSIQMWLKGKENATDEPTRSGLNTNKDSNSTRIQIIEREMSKVWDWKGDFEESDFEFDYLRAIL